MNSTKKKNINQPQHQLKSIYNNKDPTTKHVAVTVKLSKSRTGKLSTKVPHATTTNTLGRKSLHKPPTSSQRPHCWYNQQNRSEDTTPPQNNTMLPTALFCLFQGRRLVLPKARPATSANPSPQHSVSSAMAADGEVLQKNSAKKVCTMP